MKKFIPIIFILVIFPIFSCSISVIRYDSRLKTASMWLESKAGKANINIEGNWEDTAILSWGNPVFIQKDNKIKGDMGLYKVLGVINGNRVYLIAISNGYLYYTIIMDYRDNKTLKGKYISGLSTDEDFSGNVFVLKKPVKEN